MSLSRRELFGVLGAASAAALVGGCEQRPLTAAGPAPPCVVRPRQTEGPYFVDERLHRSDIRSDPSDGSVREGVLLTLGLRVFQVRGNDCTPLGGAAVDLWQCDALGVYSDVQDFNGLFDTRGRRFLRGYQVTDGNGGVEFTTIYPGWYEGRTVHIHFLVRTDPGSRQGYAFPSQLYFDEALTDHVHRQAPYASKGHRDTPNARDGIFRRGGNQLMLALSPDGPGYRGTFDLGLRFA